MGNTDPAFKEVSQLAKNGAAVTGDTLTRALVFNGQCFLVEQMHNLAVGKAVSHHTEYIRNKPLAKPGESAGAGTGKRGIRNSGFKYVAPVLSNATYQPEQVFSKMTAQGNSQLLMELTPAQMAMLVPSIRIWKVSYPSKEGPGGSLVIDRGKTPNKQEIVFDAFTQTKDLEKIFVNHQGRMSGTGIKSFKWSLKGVNPAEVDANITAELVIHFNDISDLDKKQDDSSAQFLDLIVHAAAKVRKEDRLANAVTYDGQFFEIQAVVGWAAPPGANNDLFSSEELEAIREAQTPLYLQLTKHAFKFNQDGSADLNINYRARLQDQERGFDLFNVEEKYIEAVQKTKEADPNAPAAGPAGKPAPWYKPWADDEEAPETQEQHAARELNEKLNERYSRLLQLLQPKVYNAYATPLQLRMFRTDDIAAHQEAAPTTTQAPHKTRSDFLQEIEASKASAITAIQGFAASIAAGTMEQADAAAAISQLTEIANMDPEQAAEEAYLAQAAATHGMDTSGATTQVNSVDPFELKAWLAEAGSAAMAGESWSMADSGAHQAALRAGANKAGTAAAANRAEVGPSGVPPGFAFARGPQDSADFMTAYLKGRIPATLFGQAAPVSKRDRIQYNDHSLRRAQDISRVALPADDANQQEASVAQALLGQQYAGVSHERSQHNLTRGSETADKIAVPFIFFGDIIDAAIETMNHNDNPRTFNQLVDRDVCILTGDMRFFNLERFYSLAKTEAGQNLDPLTFFREFQLGQYSFKSAAERKKLYRSVNLASFPIHLDNFLDWFVRKVVKAARQRYFFSHLIRDVLTDLVAPSLSARCFYGLPRMQSQPSLVDFPIKKGSELGQLLYPGTALKFTGHKNHSSTNVVPIEALISAGALPPVVDAGNLTPGHTMVRYLYMNTVGPDYLSGKYEDNTGAGIHHFVVGQDRGLLKSATFDRTDAPYLREGRVNRNRTLGAQQLRELYNVSLKLYGTPALKPGQYVYVTPSLFGFGNLRTKGSLARILGIGGYHLIVSVESKIDRNGYETSVKALHQSFPALEGA